MYIKFVFNYLLQVDAETGKSYTYHQLTQAVRSVASALSKNGIKKGDVVAYYSPNSVELCIALYACMSVGAVISGVNYNYTTCKLPSFAISQ